MKLLFGDTAQSYWQRVMLMTSLSQPQAASPAAFYDMLEAYYLNNGLYDLVQQALFENAIWTPGMKPLRNPAHRAVEFYVSKLWPGPLERALPIVTKNDKVKAAISQIFEWSNWGAQKQMTVRWFANFGDFFLKVSEKKDAANANKVTRVYHDPIKPKYVTELEEDERGFLTYIRMDVPAGETMHTEIWSKQDISYRIWKHKLPIGTPVAELGAPNESATFQELGFDFIPIVHAKFQDIGEVRGIGCFVHALDKIDEANRQATRLHQILFRYNKPTQAISANAMDPSGKPLPPPTLIGRDGQSLQDGGALQTGDEDLFTLPGMARLEQMVPNLQYDAALNILNAQMDELADDLPEILYFDLKDKGDLSGVAVQRLLGPAIDKALEARGNAETALVRANQMALTIAGVHGVNGFTGLGDFENGDFAHTFAERDVIPLSDKERAEIIQAEVNSGQPLIFSMRRHGYSDTEIKQMEEDLAKQKKAEQDTMANSILNAMRNRDQNIQQ